MDKPPSNKKIKEKFLIEINQAMQHSKWKK